eukprot:scaffold63587_cov28-Tisochrysis_lutea.AAC.3
MTRIGVGTRGLARPCQKGLLACLEVRRRPLQPQSGVRAQRRSFTKAIVARTERRQARRRSCAERICERSGESAGTIGGARHPSACPLALPSPVKLDETPAAASVGSEERRRVDTSVMCTVRVRRA